MEPSELPTPSPLKVRPAERPFSAPPLLPCPFCVPARDRSPILSFGCYENAHSVFELDEQPCTLQAPASVDAVLGLLVVCTLVPVVSHAHALRRARFVPRSRMPARLPSRGQERRSASCWPTCRRWASSSSLS
eukprot:6213556-Pleurochrysis_carterae.AAC.1